MQVTINGFNIEWGGTGSKRWGKLVVDYTQNGKPRKQNVMSFKNPDVFKKVQDLVGQTVEVEVVKNEKGFDEWASVGVASSTPGSSGGTAQAPARAASNSGNWETKEERAYRQVLIVKQNALTNAVAALTPGAKAALSTEDVLKKAQEFSDWVLAQEAEDNSIESLSDDIPY